MDLYQLTAHELSDLLASGQISSEELTKVQLERVNAVDPKVSAFMTITEESALAQARVIDEKRRAGEMLGPLAGIPMALKDNMCTKGIKTTCSSKILENFIPPYDATVSNLLKDAGTILLGKLNMDEFAMGSSTENSGYFITKNPWNLNCVPGGSSGGAAAAVAADEVVFSLGSDTGGSIRQPAAFCGVVGLKPTYGLVSRYGLIAYASSLDQIGPLTKDVTDLALVMNAITGHDPLDSTSAAVEKTDYTNYLVDDVKGLKVGLPKEYLGEGISPEIRQAVMEAARKLEELGAIVEEVSLPNTEYALPCYYIIAPAECSSNLARFDGVRFGYRDLEAKDLLTMFKQSRSKGFGEEVKRRIMLGTYALSSGYYDAYYLKALKVRTLIKQDFDKAFEKYDCLLTPTTPTPAFAFGDKVDNPLEMYMQDICTIPVNLAGVPGLSLPFGQSTTGLPLSVQLIGKTFGEGTLIKVAYTLEKNTDKTKLKATL